VRSFSSRFVVPAALLAIAACSHPSGSGALPPQAGAMLVAPQSAGAVNGCATAAVQPAWIFAGACQIASFSPKGAAFALQTYRGFRLSGSIGKTNDSGQFAVVDATGAGDVRAHKGKDFPQYANAGRHADLYVQLIDRAKSPVKITGSPALIMSAHAAAHFFKKGCGVAALILGKKGGPAWNDLSDRTKLSKRGNAVSIAFSTLPALRKGALFFAFTCPGAPEPTPTPTSAPTATPPATLYTPGVTGITSMTAGPDGKTWFSADDLDNDRGSVGNITTAGQTTVYALPAYNYPGDIVSVSGNLWFAIPHNSNGSPCNCIESISPQGAITAYAPLASSDQCTQSFTGRLAVGPDGNVWFTATGTDVDTGADCSKIGVFDVATKEMTTYSVSAQPYGIGRGSNGSLWFTATGTAASNFAPYIGSITTSGTIALHAIPVQAVYSGAIDPVEGADGNLWFAYEDDDNGTAGLGRLLPSGAFTAFPTASTQPLTGIAPTTGSLWVTGVNATGTDAVGKIDTNGSIAWASLGSIQPSGPIAQGADGALWFSAIIDGDTAAPNGIARYRPASLLRRVR
jgi:streptogramin lyase